MRRRNDGAGSSPQGEFEDVCFHALGIIDQNREYLQMHLLASADLPTRQALSDIQIESARVSRTVHNAMLLYRLENGEPCELQPFDVSELLEKAERMAPDIEKSLEIQLMTEREGVGHCVVMGAPDEAEQLLLHLISNALRACDAGGRVWVSLKQKKTGVVLRVEDDGCGLMEEDPIENNRRFLSGAKLGLRICRLICRRAGWKLTLTALLLVVAANVWMYVVVPKGFFPQQDTGVIMGGIRADQSASFQDMEVKLARLVRILSADPAVDQVSAHISGGRGGGGVFISLKPLEERGISAQQVIGRLRGKMSSEPGLQIFLQAAQDIMMGGRSSRSQYQYTLQADDLDSLRRWGRRLQQEFAGIRILKDVDSDIEERGLQTLLTINRDALARLGLTMKDVDAALNNAFGQRQVSTIYEEKNQYRVVLEYALPWLEGEDSLGKVWLPGKDGAVPLLGVAEVSPAFAPLSVAHQGQFAAVTLSFNLAEGASLSQAQAAIDEARVRIGMPSTIVGSFQGTAKMYSDTVREQVLLILAALAALYIVLGVLYESLIHPLTILSTLPSAGIGALLALRACGMEFSVIALIGVLLLCGIVKKNAIMMIDFAIEAARTRNLPPREAIHEACRLRFRPIMMTTAAAILGAVPLALGQGDGAEIRQPLGITIVGGLLVSQLLTLYTTPVVYLCLDRARLRWRRRWWRLRYGERKAALLTALCRQG